MSPITREQVLAWANRVLARKNATPHDLLEIPKNANMDVAQAAFHKIARIGHPDMHRTTLSPDELERVTFAYSMIAAAYQALRSSARNPTAPSATTPPPATAIGDSTTLPPRTKRPSGTTAGGGLGGGGGSVKLPGGATVGVRPGHLTHGPHNPRSAHDSHPPRPPTDSPTVTMRPSSPTLRPSTPTLSPKPTSPTLAPRPPGTTAPPRSPELRPGPSSVPPRGDTLLQQIGGPTDPSSAPRATMNSKAMLYYRKAEFALRNGDLRGALLNLRLAIAADPASTALRSALAEVQAEVDGTAK